MKRVLLVDDDPNVVQGLRRMLRSVRHEWQVESATSGPAALQAIGRESFDIVVSDMKMPGMDGAELLTAVKSLHPESIRIILSGHSERKAVMKSVASAHQYLSKPCEAEILKETIERTYALGELLGSSRLKKRVSQIDFLPSVPSLYRGLVTELESATPSLANVAKIIGRDIGMSANILKVANSAYFGLFKPVASVERAVTYLGLETIHDLLSVPIFSEYKGPGLPDFSVDALWRHSMRTAAIAKLVAEEEERDGELADYAFQAGMLHGVGKLVLAASLLQGNGQLLQNAASRRASVSDTEKAELGATYAEVGAYLLGLWGLPDLVVEAVAYHTRPWDCPRAGFGVVTILYAANRLALECDLPHTSTPLPPVESQYRKSLGLEHRLPSWRQALRIRAIPGIKS